MVSEMIFSLLDDSDCEGGYDSLLLFGRKKKVLKEQENTKAEVLRLREELEQLKATQGTQHSATLS